MNKVENEFCKFWIENGILHSCLKEPVEVTLEMTIEKIELRHRLSNNQHQYWCMDIRNLKTTSKDSFDYIDQNGQEYVYACAAIVNNYLTKFFIDSFNRIKKPRVPLKAFTTQESAIKWLTEIKENNQKA